MLLAVNKAHPSFSLTTDDSSFWGCGAYSGQEWFSMKWNPRAPPVHITVQELIPITIAAALWGRRQSGQTVQVWCDNEAAVSTINTGTSTDLEAQHLMRCLAFITASFSSFPSKCRVKEMSLQMHCHITKCNYFIPFIHRPTHFPQKSQKLF